MLKHRKISPVDAQPNYQLKTNSVIWSKLICLGVHILFYKHMEFSVIAFICLNKINKAFMCLKSALFPVLTLQIWPSKLFMCLFFSKSLWAYFWTAKLHVLNCPCAYEKWVYLELSWIIWVVFFISISIYDKSHNFITKYLQFLMKFTVCYHDKNGT